MNYKRSTLDPCVFILRGDHNGGEEPEVTRADPLASGELLDGRRFVESGGGTRGFKAMSGRLILLIDDVLEAGGPQHRESMAALWKRFRFGKYKKLQEPGGGIFNGRRIRQGPSFGIKADMADYISHKLRDIPLSKQRAKQVSSEATEQERSQLRACTMTLMWIAREGRSDILGGVSVLARRSRDATVQELLDCNTLVAHCRTTKDLGLVYKTIHPESAIFLAFSDAALPEIGQQAP